jgi:hypothetical protein
MCVTDVKRTIPRFFKGRVQLGRIYTGNPDFAALTVR